MSLVVSQGNSPVMSGISQFLKRLFSGSPTREAALALYAAAVLQARKPAFYERFHVPDSVDGRFDMVVVHVWLLLERLRAMGEVCQGLQMTLQEALFADMDRSLREMGVGDLAVGRHVKDMAGAWFGRLQAYDRALESNDPGHFAEALVRNVWRGAAPEPAIVGAMVEYVLQQHAHLGEQDGMVLCEGHVDFRGVPENEAMSS